MKTLFEVPEHAVMTFEAWTGLRVTIHDIQGSCIKYLRPDRYFHSHPVCKVVKSSMLKDKCLEFELVRLRTNIKQYANGHMHLCHAGLVEWVVPVFHDYTLQWVIFAGVRLAGDSLYKTIYKDQIISDSDQIWRHNNIVHPSKVERDEAELIMEGLLQLAARLKLWFLDTRDTLGNISDQFLYPQDRSMTIMAYIHRKHADSNANIGELAEVLHLSASHVAHIIKKLFGRSFIALLHETRAHTAASLLLNTKMTIPDIANASGFKDISHFYQVFIRETGCTPASYRRIPTDAIT